MADFTHAAIAASKAWLDTPEPMGEMSYYDSYVLPVVLQAGLIAHGAGMSEMEKDVVESLAYLCRVMENSACTMHCLNNLYHIPSLIPESVAVLTRDENTLNSVYLNAIHSSNIYTVIVALADAMVDLRNCLAAVGNSQEKLTLANNINHLTTMLMRKIDERKSKR